MATVLHLIDSRTPPAAAGLLELVRRHRPGDVLASVGPLRREDLPVPQTIIRRPWPWATAVSGVRESARQRGAAIVHCWAPELARPVAAIGLPACVSVLAPPAAASRRVSNILDNGTLFLVPSGHLRQALVAAGVEESAIHVLPPAAEPAAKPALQAAPPRRRLVLIAPPQHDADRGPYWAVWALGLLMHIDDLVELLIPGLGPAARRAEDLARQNNMLDRVRLCGLTESDEAWMAADVAVLYDRAGIGLAGLAQAVAANVPVIAADAGELAGQLVHERTALLAPPGAPLMLARAIWRLVRENGLGDRLALQARTQLAHLTDVAGWLERLESLYRRLAGQNR